MKEAKKLYLGLIPYNKATNQSISIMECWKNNGSVIVIQLENESTTYQSHCRVAALINTVRRVNSELGIKVSGIKYGEMCKQTDVKLMNYGELTLFIACKSLILKQPPAIFDKDVHLGTVPKRSTKCRPCVRCGFTNL